MTDPQPTRCYRFGSFEADAVTGELRRKGIRIRLHAQPFQLLLLLLERPGELLTREEISRALWPDGTFVDYEHGVNSAINRLREALRDTAANPRFVETLSRRGYRFIAPVEKLSLLPEKSSDAAQLQLSVAAEENAGNDTATLKLHERLLAAPEELPQASHRLVKTLFLLMQLMYVGFYVGALANLAEIDDLLSPLPGAAQVYIALIVTASVLIPVRAFSFCTVFFRAPRARANLLKLWRFLLPLDVLWALSPFLLLHHINFGLALACTTLLVYAPFAQRSLILMGAAQD